MLRSRMVGVLVVSVSLGASAGAQPPNHLACYGVRDPQRKASYTADLAGLAAQSGCKIRVPSTLACVPATASNLRPAPPGSEAAGTPSAVVCYKAKCPKTRLPALQLDDQFGSRAVAPSTSKLLCERVASAEPTTTSTTLQGDPSVVGEVQPAAAPLECYKVKDRQAKAAYKADVDGLVAALGCKVRVPATMTCVTATATNVQHTPRGLAAPTGGGAFGCYKLKCKKAALPALPITDAFGSRSIVPGAAKMLCAPIQTETSTTTTTPTTSTTSTTLGECFEPFTPVLADVLAALAGNLGPSGGLSVPASCGGSTTVCCPGGVALSPCGPLRLDVDLGSATLTPLAAPDTYGFGISMVATTVADLPVTIPVVGACGIKIDTRAGAAETVRITVTATLTPDHERMSFQPGSFVITGLTNDDVSLTGGIGCRLANLGTGLFLGTLTGTVEDAVGFDEVCRPCGTTGVVPCEPGSTDAVSIGR